MDATRTREAFDRHSLTYDERFSSLAEARAIREQVWRIADRLFSPGSRLLDLGCGTGDDAIHFAQRGLHVTSIDIAPGMISQLLLKADASGVYCGGPDAFGRIDARVADLEKFEPGAVYDGFFSNFGALNCLARVDALSSLAQKGLRPGAFVLLVTMGRFYPSEIAFFLLKGDIRRAFRRFRRTTRVAVEGIEVPVWYHTMKDLRRGLGPEFSLTSVYGLKAVDRRLSGFPALGSHSDHYVSVWRYR